MTTPERRRSLRASFEAVPERVTGRIRPGHTVRVLNLSSFGALVETSRRLRPGARVDVHLQAGESTLHTRAEVSRCYVSTLRAEQVVFRAALTLEREVPWLPVGAGHRDPGHR